MYHLNKEEIRTLDDKYKGYAKNYYDMYILLCTGVQCGVMSGIILKRISERLKEVNYPKQEFKE